MSEFRTGGCLCGAVRYEVDWPPLDVVTCSCKNCQRQAGSALSVVAFLQRDALRVTGALTTYVDHGGSGKEVWRRFCAKCGSPVVTDTPDAEAMGLIFIKAGTLDDAADLLPTRHMWVSSKQQWLEFPPGAEQLWHQ